MEDIEIAIIGGGPAGITAGIYASRSGKKAVIFEYEVLGGQITKSSDIENYPGITKAVDGLTFMEDWKKQVKNFGTEIVNKKVVSIDKNGELFELTLANKDIVKAKSVIVATGSTYKRAGIKGEDEFYGKGVSNCATCDGFFYKGKEVALVGGGETALEEALFLSNIASKVYVIHRREEFRATPRIQEKVRARDNIVFKTPFAIEEIMGDKMGVNKLRLKDLKTSEVSELEVPGIFVFIGMTIRNDLIKRESGEFFCDVTSEGKIKVDLEMKSSVEGLFAAGDIRESSLNQVVIAAGDGATAAMSAIKYLEEH